MEERIELQPSQIATVANKEVPKNYFKLKLKDLPPSNFKSSKIELSYNLLFSIPLFVTSIDVKIPITIGPPFSDAPVVEETPELAIPTQYTEAPTQVQTPKPVTEKEKADIEQPLSTTPAAPSEPTPEPQKVSTIDKLDESDVDISKNSPDQTLEELVKETVF